MLNFETSMQQVNIKFQIFLFKKKYENVTF
jgi:hypothetical protein